MLDLEYHLHVALHVQRQVVGPAEGSLAQLALERPVPRVLPLVPRQLVRAREPPPATSTRQNVKLAISTSPGLPFQLQT